MAMNEQVRAKEKTKQNTAENNTGVRLSPSSVGYQVFRVKGGHRCALENFKLNPRLNLYIITWLRTRLCWRYTKGAMSVVQPDGSRDIVFF
jgi:hypothetical protein